jgi:hypothetical protein
MKPGFGQSFAKLSKAAKVVHELRISGSRRRLKYGIMVVYQRASICAP